MGPTFDDVIAAARRLRPHVRRTPVLHSDQLDDHLGRRVWCKAEHRQVTGSFKFRGASNAVLQLTPAQAERGVATHSSGNHAAALAAAATQRGLRCIVVMPSDAVAAKRAAAERHGATIIECAPTLADREAVLRRVIEQEGLIEIHPYDNDTVIAGAGTAALELLEDVPDIGVVVVPVGGGGLASGTSLASHGLDTAIRVVGAEPAGADDAARSLATHKLVRTHSPDTIADGLRTTLSERTFAILTEHLSHIITVTDDEIIEAMRLLRHVSDQVVEPSGAVGVAALRHLRDGGDAAAVGVILSGGNVDTASA